MKANRRNGPATKLKQPKLMMVGSLFTGVGGFDLGLERAGMVISWQVELAEYPRAILRKHWPHVRLHDDVETFPPAGSIEEWRVDLIAGGFPCTDLTNCLKASHAGIHGPQSGLVVEFARIADLLRPTWLLMENVIAVRKYKTILTQLFPHWRLELEDIDYSRFGCATRRRRTFIVGHLGTGSIGKVFDLSGFVPTIWQTGGAEDALPMCMPWKGGLSLERLGSCLVENPETHATRMRTGDGISGRLDSRRWLAVGNSVAPPVAEWIGRQIILRDGELRSGSAQVTTSEAGK